MSSASTAGLAGLGALLTVLAWAGWGVVHANDPSDPLATPTRAVTPAEVLPATEQQPLRATAAETTPQGVRDRVGAALVEPARATPATSVLRDGFVMRHGMLTAVRVSGASIAAQPTAVPGSVALPPGVRPEDATISPAGVVTVIRAGGAASQSAAGDAMPGTAAVDVAANPFRPATATHSP